jgi:predicted MFS family arabinose efflux permease
MIAFPFANGFALDRAKQGNQGEYMAMYAMAFSVGSIFGHNTGLHLVDAIGFDNTWYIMGALAMIGVFLLFVLKLNMKKKTITTTLKPSYIKP